MVVPALTGWFNVSLTSPTNGTKQFAIDTSFAPYRRLSFRHTSIAAQRESVDLTNIAGEGTVNTEGLWRREQTEWTMGAGQLFLDRKRSSQENRFLSSKGVDVFSFPMQATLLPDTVRKDAVSSPGASLLMSRCGDYVVVANGSSVVYYNSSWSSTSCTFGSTYGGTAPSAIRSITTNDTYCYLAADTGIWFCQIGVSSVFELYSLPDVTTGYTGGFDMVRWANDQLLASSHQALGSSLYGNNLYAFQPRTATSFPTFGDVPAVGDTNVPIQYINSIGGSGSAEAYCTSAHNMSVGQPFTIQNTSILAYIDAGSSPGFSGVTLTLQTNDQHGFNVNDTVTVSLQFGNGGVRSETVTITAVPSDVQFSYVPTQVGPPIYATGLVTGQATGNETGEYNASWVVASVVSATQFTFVVPTNFAFEATGGSVTSSVPPDLLFTHENPNYVWSDATGGETQIYFGGYVKSPSGVGYSGCIYRSDLLGSSTTTETGVATIANSVVAQPFALDTPVQALPMSPDEYPTCVKSYLNYIFIGTNRGIRMCQTLSIYDPTATATGDLKSGPLVPNILQPVTLPVTAIVGDGRYVWFAWSNYDGDSTGLGKLDLSTYIDGDPLSPAYASDLMVTAQGVINSLDWDPINNTPLICVASSGVYGPYATNEGGNIVVSKYVASGTISSGIFDYGISDQKIPVYFDFGAIAGSGSNVAASVITEPTVPGQPTNPLEVSQSVPSSGSFASGDVIEYSLTANEGQQFQVVLTLTSGDTQTVSPVLNRWTLKCWPAVVQGTNIMVVINNASVIRQDDEEYFQDPYENFIWMENERQLQEVLTYTEGPLSVQCVISINDWLPNKERATYQLGFEGLIIATLTTLGPYVYTAPATS